jgi:hypothetical protein
MQSTTYYQGNQVTEKYSRYISVIYVVWVFAKNTYQKQSRTENKSG